jgi:hypothetical protein
MPSFVALFVACLLRVRVHHQIPLPKCPINPESIHNATVFPIPSKDPLPIKVAITGTVILTDSDGTTPLDKLEIVASVSPDAEM